jgi:hypothetical protein
MANINGRRIKDATFIDASAALPTADGTSYSADIDLEITGYKGENYELEVTIPSLTAEDLPNADTLTVNIVAGAAANPTSVILGSVIVVTGTGSASTAVTDTVRLPSDCPRYVRAQFVAAGGTGDISDKDATVQLLF